MGCILGHLGPGWTVYEANYSHRLISECRLQQLCEAAAGIYTESNFGLSVVKGLENGWVDGLLMVYGGY